MKRDSNDPTIVDVAQDRASSFWGYRPYRRPMERPLWKFRGKYPDAQPVKFVEKIIPILLALIPLAILIYKWFWEPQTPESRGYLLVMAVILGICYVFLIWMTVDAYRIPRGRSLHEQLDLEAEEGKRQEKDEEEEE